VSPKGHGQNQGPGGNPHEGGQGGVSHLERPPPVVLNRESLLGRTPSHCQGAWGQNRGHPCHLCPGEGGRWSALGTICARTNLMACPTAMCHLLGLLRPILKPLGQRCGRFVDDGGQGDWAQRACVCACVSSGGNRAQLRPHARPTGLHNGDRPKRVGSPWIGLRSVVLEPPCVAKGVWPEPRALV
jgi:hypothetical protein